MYVLAHTSDVYIALVTDMGGTESLRSIDHLSIYNVLTRATQTSMFPEYLKPDFHHKQSKFVNSIMMSYSSE